MDLVAISVRALFAYAFLLLIVRIAGKRSIAQGTTLDFVVALILGDLIDDVLWAEVPAAQFVVAVGSIALTHAVTSLGVCVSPRFARWIEGAPTTVIRATPRSTRSSATWASRSRPTRPSRAGRRAIRSSTSSPARSRPRSA